MKFGVIFVLLFLLPVALAQEQYQDYNSIYLNTKIISELTMDSGVSYISSEIFFFPRNLDHQSITKRDYSAKVIEKQDSLLYEWSNPGEGLTFGLDYDISSSFNDGELKSKIPFPIKAPQEYDEYLESDDLINSNNALIKEQAKSIIGDEDDLYEVVYKLASWSRENINYSLETLTEELTQNSVWVLENKKGVCDELTVLFISMLRSQGIPAKFVSGQSYTNVIPGFGNHAWAEVYFPGKGWIPFDVTYGQYGYVDATHIKMRESASAKDPSARYIWKPGEKSIDVKPLNISTIITSTGNLLPHYVNINLNVLKNKLKAGSYLPLEIDMENTRDSYLSTMLYITKAPTNMESNVKSVLLKPNEKKKVYWIINVPEDLDDSYLYTSRIEILDFFGDSSEAEVEYANKYNYYSLDEAREKIHQLELENRNPEDTLDLFCFPEKVKYYDYENASFRCRIGNSEERSYSLDLCFDKCERIMINPSEKMELNFTLSLEAGGREYHVEMSNDEIIKSSYFDVNVISPPKIEIDNLNHPEEIGYGDSGEITFDMNTDSGAKNLAINIGNDRIFSFEAYQGKENIVIPFKGKYFYNKNSKIIVEYEDDNGRRYSVEKEIIIKVTNVPFYAKIGYWWILIGLVILAVILRRRFVMPRLIR